MLPEERPQQDIDHPKVTLILGIDPGINGAAALIRAMPAAGAIAQCFIEAWTIEHRRPLALAAKARLNVVEAQHASPQMGVRSAFALGLAYGAVRGVLAAVPNLKVEYVQPAVWRGSYGLGGGAAGKQAGVAMAREILREPNRPMTHDEADAVLLAWWGWRNIILNAGNRAARLSEPFRVQRSRCRAMTAASGQRPGSVSRPCHPSPTPI